MPDAQVPAATGWCSAPIGELVAAIATREVSAREIVGAFLARIESYEADVGAFITVLADSAVAEAAARDEAGARGGDLGALHGVPVAVKDVFDTAGVRTTAGSQILARCVPERDATVVRRLREAGAVLMGKTNMHEFAFGCTTENPFYGDTHNPLELGRIAGGSSGGSAAALAAGFCAGALGSDTGGSVRAPAALCGVVGLAPAAGRVSTSGMVPLSWELDRVGPMGRCVEDVARLLAAIAGWDAADPSTMRNGPEDVARTPAPVRLAVDMALVRSHATPEVAALFTTTVERLAGTWVIVELALTELWEDAITAASTILLSEALAVHEEWLRTRAADYGPDVLARLTGAVGLSGIGDALRARLDSGGGVTGSDYARAHHAKRRLVRRTEELFIGIDAIATPTCGITAPRLGQETVELDEAEVPVAGPLTWFTRPVNLLGLPAISVPCGVDTAGLPVGLQLVGQPFGETRLLQVAAACESLLGR